MNSVNPYSSPRSHVQDTARTDEYGEIKVFSVRGRLGRVRYIAYSMGLALLGGVIVALFGAIGAALSKETARILLIVGGVAGYGFMLVSSVMLMVQRLHDFNTSGWLGSLMFIPIVNAFFGLALWFIPGTDGPNRFGAKTPPNSTGAVLVASIVPLVMVVGIVAAIAIPAYSGYVQRAHQDQQVQQIQAPQQ